jgi:hypothetical protein
VTVVRSRFEPRPNDLFDTPAWVTLALLKHFPLVARAVWEPFAGNHAMVDVLREHGAGVSTSDIETYSRPQDFIFDFLDERAAPGHFFTDIVSNPPYGARNAMAAKAARLALQRCSGLVAMLLTAKFDFGKTRADLFADNTRFCAKIALVDRIKWFEGPGSVEGTEDNAWFIWAPVQYPISRPYMLWATRSDV